MKLSLKLSENMHTISHEFTQARDLTNLRVKHEPSEVLKPRRSSKNQVGSYAAKYLSSCLTLALSV